MSSEQNMNQGKPSSAPGQVASGKASGAGNPCSKESSHAPTVSPFPGGGLARGIYSCTLGRSKPCGSNDTTHAPVHEKCDSGQDVEEKRAEKTPDKAEDTELKATDPGSDPAVRSRILEITNPKRGLTIADVEAIEQWHGGVGWLSG